MFPKYKPSEQKPKNNYFIRDAKLTCPRIRRIKTLFGLSSTKDPNNYPTKVLCHTFTSKAFYTMKISIQLFKKGLF